MTDPYAIADQLADLTRRTAELPAPRPATPTEQTNAVLAARRLIESLNTSQLKRLADGGTTAHIAAWHVRSLIAALGPTYLADPIDLDPTGKATP